MQQGRFNVLEKLPTKGHPQRFSGAVPLSGAAIGYRLLPLLFLLLSRLKDFLFFCVPLLGAINSSFSPYCATICMRNSSRFEAGTP